MSTLQKVTGMESNQNEHWMPALICLGLALLTIIAFSQIKDCGFINLDDNVYVYENADIQTGFNWESVKKVVSFELAKSAGHWHPVTWLSWMLDYSIFGHNPFGYHLVNLLFHVLNTILLFLILFRMTKALWPSAFVAALFAIHPLHVESVAWVTERKDVLSTFFWMLTLGAYSYYVEHRDLKRYILVILFFALGLMSKSMLVTLPFVLLLLDFWPFQRFAEAAPAARIPAIEIKQELSGKKKKTKKKDAEKAAATVKAAEIKKPVVPEFKWSLIYPLIIEKIPFFALSIFSSIAAYVAAQKAGTVGLIEVLSPTARIGNAFVSYVTYIVKMILPVNLAVLYPHSGSMVLWQVFGSVILLLTITFFVIWRIKKSPYLATGWFWYLGTLVPVIGIVQVGAQAMADRYTYIPLIGLFIIVAWGIAEVSQKWKYRKEILVSSSVLILLVLSILTWKQVGYWKDSLTLFDYTLKVTDNNWFIHNSRGASYHILGDYRQAIDDYNTAILLNPRFPSSYYNRCLTLNSLGKYGMAIPDCSRAIDLKSGYAEAYNARGNASHGLGNTQQAIEDYNRAIELEPIYAEAYYNRGIAYNVLGDYKQAIEDYGRAIHMKPHYVDAYNNRGAVYYVLGNNMNAIENYNRAIAIRPDFAGAYNNRGLAYAGLGNMKQAILDLKTAAGLGDERAKDVLKRQGIVW